MTDVYCPFCGSEGFAVKNNGAKHQNRKGNLHDMWGIWFPIHDGYCPFLGLRYRCDYISKQEAIDAHVIKYSKQYPSKV